MTDVVVAGGGLAGLVAARRLADRGLDVTLFERRSDPGGRVRSVRRDGFVFDRGFQVLFTAYPAVKRELALDDLDLRYFSSGATIARPGERSTLADPFRNPGALLSSLSCPEVTLSDKLRVLRLRRQLRAKDADEIFDGDDGSIAEYLREFGFSEQFVEHFAGPFYGGITLDRSLSTASSVFEYTFKMLSEGRTAVPAAGMGAIGRQLADRARDAGATVELDATVSAVSGVDGEAAVTVEGETVDADEVVVATDPKTAADLTGVASIPTDGVGSVTQWVSAPERRMLDTGRRLILNAADERPNQVAPMSAVAPEYAPDGRALFAATFLGRPEEDDETLFEDVRHALASWYPGHHFDGLRLEHTSRVPFAQFVQQPGFRSSLPTVDDPDGPVYLAGDYTQWSSIQGALASGRVAAEAVVADR
jgi:phytoene dehydrogenase-like protein